jgi:ArsR family transcriptional regulator
VVAEPNRLRILLLLQKEELSVAELQEILGMGQSTISTHLSQLKQAGLVEDRRTGKSNLYRLASGEARKILNPLLEETRKEISESTADQIAMRRALKKRLAEALLSMMPPMVIADLGAGEGGFALLLAQQAVKVIAIDTSDKMIEVGREQALRQGVSNVEYRLGDMEEVPIDDAVIDVVFFSQSLHHALHPERAVQEARRILKPGGRVVILDLVKHRFEEAREMYADQWLGFSEAEMDALLEAAGFADVKISIVHKEPATPQFQTLLAVGEKPAAHGPASSS